LVFKNGVFKHGVFKHEVPDALAYFLKIGLGAYQGFGSGSGLDPYSIGPVDPDPESGSGSRRAKMTHKSIKIF
jgi:hypothetical protein